MPLTPQFGFRSWQFTPDDTSLSALLQPATDFFMVYTSQVNGEQTQYGVTLNTQWIYTNFGLAFGVPQRVYLEDLMSSYARVYQNLRGTLVLDVGTASQRTLAGIWLKDIQWSIQDSNQLLESTMRFDYPLSSLGGQNIARSFQFGDPADGDKIAVSSDNLLVEWNTTDKTVFKEVFRAAPVRIPGGSNVYSIKLRGAHERVAAYGSSPLAFRQAAEARIQAWSILNIGRERSLYIDGVNIGPAHLRTVTPQTLDLPQAVAYELEFYQGYVD